MSHSLPYLLRLSKAPHIGPKRFRSLLEVIDDLEYFLTKEIWSPSIPLHSETKIYLMESPWDDIEAELKWQEQPQHEILTLLDPLYPTLLKEIEDPPSILYVKGNVDWLEQPQIAIVGSRQASRNGRQLAHAYAAALSQVGFGITSGLAYGIDSAAHQGALTAKGTTIAVLGSGLNCIYPRAHRHLADTIMNNGALVSEYPPTSPPKASHFPARNRIISGLAKGTLIVEATLKSGSLITARYALEQGRELFALPNVPGYSLAQGCHALIREGAKLIDSVEQLLEEFLPIGLTSSFYPKTQLNKNQTIELSHAQQVMVDNLNDSVTPIDMLIQQTGFPAEKVTAILVELELEGLAIEMPGGYSRKL
jgi:DNA processing protein